jgi:hypothetical protein
MFTKPLKSYQQMKPAKENKRKWIAMELNESYLEGSRFRFDKRNF